MRSIMRRLTKTQKAKNRATYKQIRKVWETTDKSVSYKEFKRIVLGYVRAGKYDTAKEAAKKYAHSYQYTDAETIGKENILKGLKEDFRPVYDELRHKVGVMQKGEHLSDQIEWDKDKQSYVLTAANGDRYMIDISNSPKSAVLIKLN